MSQASNPDKYYVPEGSWWPLISIICVYVKFFKSRAGFRTTFLRGAPGQNVFERGDVERRVDF